MFLRNPLTADGMRYVRDALADGNGVLAVLQEWAEEYGFPAPKARKGKGGR